MNDIGLVAFQGNFFLATKTLGSGFCGCARKEINLFTGEELVIKYIRPSIPGVSNIVLKSGENEAKILKHLEGKQSPIVETKGIDSLDDSIKTNPSSINLKDKFHEPTAGSL